MANAVSINNAQPSNEEHVWDIRGITINHHHFTQSLVDALEMELKRNEVAFTESTENE